MVLNLNGPQIQVIAQVKWGGGLGRLNTASYEIEECEIRATLLSDTFDGDAISMPSSHSSQLASSCPACTAETFLGDQFCQECGSTLTVFESQPRFTIDKVTGLLGSPKITLVALGVLLAVVFSGAAIMSAIAIPGDLDKAIAANRLNDATTLAERLYLARLGALEGREAEAYSEAYYKRGQIFAKNGNYANALDDLKKVLPTYSKSTVVAQTIFDYQLYLSQGNSRSQAGTTISNATHSVASQTKTKQVAIQNVSKMPAASNIKTPESRTQKVAAVSDVDSIEGQLLDSTNTDRDEVNLEEVDMAAYNSQLAEYFSRKEKNSKGSQTKDPPSFSEWVQSGKAQF